MGNRVQRHGPEMTKNDTRSLPTSLFSIFTLSSLSSFLRGRWEEPWRRPPDHQRPARRVSDHRGGDGKRGAGRDFQRLSLTDLPRLLVWRLVGHTFSRPFSMEACFRLWILQTKGIVTFYLASLTFFPHFQVHFPRFSLQIWEINSSYRVRIARCYNSESQNSKFISCKSKLRDINWFMNLTTCDSDLFFSQRWIYIPQFWLCFCKCKLKSLNCEIIMLKW